MFGYFACVLDGPNVINLAGRVEGLFRVGEMAVMVISRKLPPCAASFLNFCLTLRKLGRLVNHACPKALGPGLIHGHSLAETHSFTLMKIIV